MNKESFIKRNFLAVSLSTMAVIGFSMMTWTSWRFFRNKQAQVAKVNQLEKYQQEIIPLLKSKADKVNQILKIVKIQDSNLNGILTHVPSWNVNSLQSLQEIEELASYFDLYLSAHIEDIQAQASTKIQVRDLLKELQETDRALTAQRKNLKI